MRRSQAKRITVRRVALATTLALLAALTACSGGGPPAERADVDPAVALFVSGRYDAAIDALEKLAASSQSEEVLREVYYYLGRSYLERGETSRAIDAFSAGVAHGDRGGCLEYFDRLRAVVEGEGRALDSAERISRRQLAATIARTFLRAQPDDPALLNDPDHWLRKVVERGWMETLPDGALHGDAVVTRGALAVIASRIATDLHAPVPTLERYRRTLAASGTRPVSGREAVALVGVIAAARR